MQKIIMEGLLALSPPEVSELLKHVGLQSFAAAFDEEEVPSYQNTDTLLTLSLPLPDSSSGYPSHHTHRQCSHPYFHILSPARTLPYYPHSPLCVPIAAYRDLNARNYRPIVFPPR